jgi:hypothetical protein
VQLTSEKAAVQKQLDDLKGTTGKELESVRKQLEECNNKGGGNVKQKVSGRQPKRACCMLHAYLAFVHSMLHMLAWPCHASDLGFRLKFAQLADARAKLDEAQKHLDEIQTP